MMAMSPVLKRMVELGRARYRVTHHALHRVPAPTQFAMLTIIDQAAMIENVQRELDVIAEGLRNGSIPPNDRGRGAALRNVRKRQQRLDKLAHDFGFRREWRKRIRVKAISQPESIAA